jgi:aldose 1-epimerase
MLHLSRGGRRLLAFVTASSVAIGLLAGLSSAGFAHPAKAHRSHKAHWSHGGGGAGFEVQSWSTPGTPSGVFLWTLTNGRGMTVSITNYGATVQTIWVPDKWGKARNVALGFQKLSDYVNDFTQGSTNTPWPLPGGSGDTFFGATIGRYANRIAGAKFTMSCTLCSNNGKTYTLDVNNGVNTRTAGSSGGTPSSGQATRRRAARTSR